VQALFDSAVLRLPCVIGDRGGQAAGPVTSAMRRKRPTTVSGPHVVMGESPGGISPPGAPRSVHEPLDSHGSRNLAYAGSVASALRTLSPTIRRSHAHATSASATAIFSAACSTQQEEFMEETQKSRDALMALACFFRKPAVKSARRDPTR